MKPYKFRKAESNIEPKLVEYSQNGILMRFDINKVKRDEQDNMSVDFFEYKEFWFDKSTANIAEIVKSKGYVISAEQKKLLK